MAPLLPLLVWQLLCCGCLYSRAPSCNLLESNILPDFKVSSSVPACGCLWRKILPDVRPAGVSGCDFREGKTYIRYKGMGMYLPDQPPLLFTYKHCPEGTHTKNPPPTHNITTTLTELFCPRPYGRTSSHDIQRNGSFQLRTSHHN